MESAFKTPRCEVEFQVDHSDDNRGGYVCYECLLGKDSWDSHIRTANPLEAILHLRSHVEAGHMVPQSLIASLQVDLAFQTIVHQSGMSPLRRYDGSLSAHRELAFHEQWVKEQDGTGILFSHLSNLGFLPMTQRDATLAATLIQWLGTNVGFAFLEDALKRAGFKIVKIESVIK